MEENSKSIGAMIGGTVLAFFVAVVVILVVSTVVTFVASMFNYYFGNMREEAAFFLGNIFGGVVSINAARAACDATIKLYSSRSLFVLIAILLIGLGIFEFTLEWNVDRVYRLAFLVPTFGMAFFVFWKEDF